MVYLKFRPSALLIGMILTTALFASPRPQQSSDDESTRYVFLETRKNARKKLPRRTVSKTPPAAVSAQNIGLGYTLYRLTDEGKTVRVDPAQTFYQGDRVRFVFESNSDGYFYLFHAENGANPKMLFPDARLNGGGNRIRAHVPFEVPSSREPNPAHRWFSFKDKPAVEHMYFIAAKEPITGIPTGKELVAYCGQYADGCPWRPAEAVWKAVEDASKTQTWKSDDKNYGQALSKAEELALNRDIGLDSDAPAPSIVQISLKSNSKMLVAQTSLKHER